VNREVYLHRKPFRPPTPLPNNSTTTTITRVDVSTINEWELLTYANYESNDFFIELSNTERLGVSDDPGCSLVRQRGIWYRRNIGRKRAGR